MDHDRENLLMKAIKYGHIDMLPIVVKLQDVNHLNNFKETPLIYLSVNKHPPKSFVLLCEMGADHTKSDKWGNTALMEYVGQGIPE